MRASPPLKVNYFQLYRQDLHLQCISHSHDDIQLQVYIGNEIGFCLSHKLPIESLQVILCESVTSRVKIAVIKLKIFRKVYCDTIKR